jgi:hypothetical protein
MEEANLCLLVRLFRVQDVAAVDVEDASLVVIPLILLPLLCSLHTFDPNHRPTKPYHQAL